MLTVAALTLSPIAAGFGLGIALASAPGPVQAIILTESVRGGIPRGARAQAGANLTFTALLVCLACGLSIATPGDFAFRALKVTGGALLLWLAIDTLRSPPVQSGAPAGRPALPPEARGTLAVLLNPGAWLFLATAASSLLSAAARTSGTPGALIAALALSIGLAIGDGAVVLFGGLGIRHFGSGAALWIQRVLAAILAALGIWLIASGLIP